MQVARTGFSNASSKSHVCCRWTRTLTVSNEAWPIACNPGSSSLTTPTTPISSWIHTCRQETEATSSSPAAILNVEITTRWDTWKSADSPWRMHYHFCRRLSIVRYRSHQRLPRKGRRWWTLSVVWRWPSHRLGHTSVRHLAHLIATSKSTRDVNEISLTVYRRISEPIINIVSMPRGRCRSTC